MKTWTFGDRTLTIGGKTLIMGILNVTPDSFSDGGHFQSLELAVARAKEMVAEGADIIDVGGESTRPGSEKVSLQEELKRVIPVIRALKGEISVPISVDTYKAEVARQALEAGAHIVNDVWGFKEDPDIAQAAASYGYPVILMHNRKIAGYGDFLADVIADLKESVEIAVRAGVPKDSIILDPGIGFAKTREQNLFLMNHLRDIVSIGYPVLLGTSRKRMIRNTLDLPADDVVEGTAATVALGIAQGCDIMRVHDVKQMKRVAVMTDAIVRQESSIQPVARTTGASGKTDSIKLSRMQFYGYHGVLPEENRLGQHFIIDVDLFIDLTAAGASDRLEDTVNYADVYGIVRTIAEGKPFQLIEALAERVASQLLQTYTSIYEITVRITKPHPPFETHFDGVTVEIHRKRASFV